VLLLVKDKPKNNYFLLGFITSILLWTLATLLFLTTTGPWILISAKLIYIFGAYLPLFNILFSQTLVTKEIRPSYTRFQIVLFVAVPILMSIMVLFPGAVVKDVILNPNAREIIHGPLYVIFALFQGIYFSGAFWSMYRIYTKLKGIEKKQFGIVFSSIALSTIAAFIVSLIMPISGNFTLFWAGSFFSGYTLVMITYAIVRYGLFNIKIVATEFITIATWFLLFAKIFFNTNMTGVIVDLVVLILIIIGGVFTIKAVQKEMALNDRLNLTNIQLKELDEKKTEFMSLATHQLRTPLTAMRGYSSMILDGTFGKEQNPDIQEAVSKIERSTTDLAMIVEDYLNISLIEQGRMQYNFVKLDVTTILKSIITDMKSTIDRHGLTIIIATDGAPEYTINADTGKIRQVFSNIIDNAIKYTPAGHIDIFISKTEKGKVLVKIEDTGVGIGKEVLPTLFNKYVRAPDASKVNILGTGLGLYVAGEILKAHSGRAWGESAGVGKGSRFFVELDLV
jgi:signal transduction histidine kinase